MQGRFRWGLVLIGIIALFLLYNYPTTSNGPESETVMQQNQIPAQTYVFECSDGYRFTARILEITAGQKIVFVGDYGETRLVFATPEPVVDNEARTTVYEVEEDSHKMMFTIQGRSCHDTMSGEPFDAAVTVVMDGREFRGCGKELQ